LTRQLVGLKLLERGIPRHGYEVYSVDGLERLGFITSGTQSPCLKEAIAVAYVKPTHSTLGAQIKVEIRGVKVLGEVVATPFLKRK